MGKLAAAFLIFAALGPLPAAAQNQFTTLPIPTTPVSQLPSVTTPLTGSEILYIVQGGVSKQGLSSLFTAAANAVLQPLAILPYSSPYLAAGNCTANDSAALTAASAAAVTAGVPVLIDRCYRMSTNEALAANLIFANGGYLSVDSGVTATLTGQITAPSTAQIFAGAGGVGTVVSAASFVSVAWWGAMTATDPGPAFRAALGSNRTYLVPPGTYTFGSFVNGFIGAASPGGGLVSSLVFINGLTNFNVFAYGATITQLSTIPVVNGGCNCGFFFNNNQNYTWSGGTIVGIKNGSNTNDAFVNHNAVNFVFRDVHLTGNFGSPFSSGGGTGVTGDFEVNGKYENFVMDAVGLGFDLAFLSHVTLDNVRCNGAGVDGGSGAGDYGRACVSVIYDTTSLGFNTTGINLPTSDNVIIENSRAQNFNYALLLGDGVYFNVHDNYIIGGNITPPPYGIYVAWSNSASVPQGWTFQDNILNSFQNCFATITAGLSGSLSFANFHIGGGTMQNCSTAAITTDDATGAFNTNFVIAPDIAYSTNGADISASMGLVSGYGGSKSSVTIANLGVCGASNVGQIKYVKDTVASTTATLHAVIAGGGATAVAGIATCNGSAWQWD